MQRLGAGEAVPAKKPQSIRPSEERDARGQRSRTFRYLNIVSIISLRQDLTKQR